MKKKLFLFFVFITSVNYSQVQKIFYVDDVKTIDYVSVTFCVNDSARISEVTVIPEKTTYKNNYNIEGLIEYLKGIQYYPDSKLRNNCYPSTFEFVNSKFENAELNENEWNKIEKFKVGKFKYEDVRYSETKIKRTKNKQTEISPNFKAKYKIIWTSPYEYEMTYLKVREKENKHYIGQTIKVKIIGILDNGYIYVSNFTDKPPIIGVMTKIN